MDQSAADMPVHTAALNEHKKMLQTQENIMKSYTDYFNSEIIRIAPPPVPEPATDTITIDALSLLISDLSTDLTNWMSRKQE